MGCRRRYAILGVLLVFVAGSGCGYTLAGRANRLPERIRTIGIPPLGNDTAFQRIEQVLTDKIRAEFIGRGRYRVVSEASGADAVLSGTIAAVSLEPVAFTDDQRASRYLVTLRMNVRFVEAATDETIWSNDAMTFREEYELATQGLADLGGEFFVDQERSAVDRIATDVARRVVREMLE